MASTISRKGSLLSQMTPQEKIDKVTFLSKALPEDPSFIKPNHLGKESTLLAKALVKDGKVQTTTPHGLNKLSTYVNICDASEQVERLVKKNEKKRVWPKSDVFEAFRAIETWTPGFFSQPKELIESMVKNRFTKTYVAVYTAVREMGGWQAAVKKYKAEKGYA